MGFIQGCDDWDTQGLFFTGGRNPEINHLGDWEAHQWQGFNHDCW